MDSADNYPDNGYPHGSLTASLGTTSGIRRPPLNLNTNNISRFLISTKLVFFMVSLSEDTLPISDSAGPKSSSLSLPAWPLWIPEPLLLPRVSVTERDHKSAFFSRWREWAGGPDCWLVGWLNCHLQRRQRTWVDGLGQQYLSWGGLIFLLLLEVRNTSSWSPAPDAAIWRERERGEGRVAIYRVAAGTCLTTNDNDENENERILGWFSTCGTLSQIPQ